MNTTHIAQRLQPEKAWEEQLPVAAMIFLRLLPGALTMLLMLLVSLRLPWKGV